MLKLKLIKKEPLKLKITSSFPSIILANLQDKTVTPSEEEQVITADNGFDGLREVTVEGVLLQNKTIVPSKEEQIIKADERFTGLNEVTVNQVTSEIDENIIAENIKDGVDILGVIGNFVGKKYAPKHISFYYYEGNNLDYEVANLDTSNITNMYYMFSYSSVTELDLSNFITNKVTDMYGVFNRATKLKSLNVSNWNTSNATRMNYMFNYCQVLQNLDVSNFDTSKVNDMSYMFTNCQALTTLNLSNFNTSNVTKMPYIFQSCQTLTTLDLSNWDTSKVTDMTYMCEKCYRLKKLIINSEKLFELKNNNCFNNTPIAGYTNYTNGEKGYIYVPDDMVETYKKAQYWSTYASQIKGISELPEE